MKTEIPNYLIKEELEFLEALFYKSMQSNPYADRLRRCPGCGVYHFVKHRGTDYHDPKCADDHYNLKQSTHTHALKAGFLKVNEGTPPQVKEITKLSLPLLKSSSLPAEIITKTSVNRSIQLKNEEIIIKLLGSVQEAAITPYQLFSRGFEEEGFDTQVLFPNSSCTLCIVGEYCLSWFKEETIIISLLKNMLWIYI